MSLAKYEIHLSSTAGNLSDTGPMPPLKGTIKLRESLTAPEAEKLSRDLMALLVNGCRQWEMDLDDLNHCDSGTLGVFIGTHATIRKRAGKLTLRVKPDSAIHRILKTARLNQVLSILPS